MNQLDKESDETHNQKSDAGGACNLSKLLAVWLGAFFDKVDGVLGELAEGLDEDFVEAFFF